MNNITNWLMSSEDKKIATGINVGCSTCPAYNHCKMWLVLEDGIQCVDEFKRWALKEVKE